jgi:hypothetical protein
MLLNPNVYYRIHKSHLLVPVLSQTNPAHITQPISLRLSLILYTHIRFDLPAGYFLLAFPPISHTHSSAPPFMSISSSLTLFYSNLWKSKIYEDSDNAVFSNLSVHLSSVQIFPKGLSVPPLMSEFKFHTHTEPQLWFNTVFTYINYESLPKIRFHGMFPLPLKRNLP